MKLTANKEILQAEKACFSVFRDRSPFREPLQESIPGRALIYPVDTYPDDDLYFALANAAAALGETEAYFSTSMDVTEDSYITVDYWKLDLDDYPFNEQGMKDNGWISILESVIFSVDGTWGVLMTNREFGIVGATNPFMEALHEWVSDLDEQVRRLVSRSRTARAEPGEAFDWIPGVLSHVYGSDKAADLMR